MEKKKVNFYKYLPLGKIYEYANCKMNLSKPVSSALTMVLLTEIWLFYYIFIQFFLWLNSSKMFLFRWLHTVVVSHLIFFVQLSQHNKELASLLKPTGKDIYGDQALDFYAKHTAQIEVSKNDYFYLWIFLF